MKYRLFGNTGLRVSEICLGTMTFGEELEWGSSKEASKEVFDAYVDAGGNFFDTANKYMKGSSEKILGEFIKGNREQFVIGTKYSLSTDPNDPNGCGNHRKNMVQSVEASLKRLNTDYIDIYWLHAWDYMTPVEEVMRAFDDLVRAGKVLYIGISDTPAWIVSKANTLAELRGWTSFAGLQLEYSLVERTIEREFVGLAEHDDLAITAWSPLAMGILTGKYLDSETSDARFQKNPEWGKRFLTDRNNGIAKAVVEVAKEIGRTPAQVALGWVQAQGKRFIPIVGAKNKKQLQDNLGSVDVELSKKQLDRLDQVSRIELGFPHEFLKREGIIKVLFGETYDKIVSAR